MSHLIYVNRDRRGLGHPDAWRHIKAAVCAALDEEGVAERCEVSVLLTDDASIREINLEQRNIDRATDVLSFPQNELAPGAFDPAICERDPETGAIFLGDMVLSLERCQAQSEEYGHSFEREISYLTVHSVLHLLGYDHLDEGEQKKRMRAREDVIMARLGL